MAEIKPVKFFTGKILAIVKILRKEATF